MPIPFESGELMCFGAQAWLVGFTSLVLLHALCSAGLLLNEDRYLGKFCIWQSDAQESKIYEAVEAVSPVQEIAFELYDR